MNGISGPRSIHHSTQASLTPPPPKGAWAISSCRSYLSDPTPSPHTFGPHTFGSQYDHVRLPRGALLSRFCDVTPEGAYLQKVKVCRSVGVWLAQWTRCKVWVKCDGLRGNSLNPCLWVPTHSPHTHLDQGAANVDMIFLAAFCVSV